MEDCSLGKEPRLDGVPNGLHKIMPAEAFRTISSFYATT